MSPTYDGIVSDVGEIAKIVHRAGLPLIVDEAHGLISDTVKYFRSLLWSLGRCSDTERT